MAEEIWKEANKPASTNANALVRSMPPVLDTPLPPFLPITVLEDISNHIAAIASRLSMQCSSKTPPGMAQIIIRLQMENAELKQQLTQSQQEVQDVRKSLRKIAQGMREQAEKFDATEKKFALDVEQEPGTSVLHMKE
jgi:FtsZ-binding cell division protein ZapB